MKTCLQDFRPGRTQTGLYNHKRMASGLKFGNEEEEGLYYLNSKNRGAGQLHGQRAADLRLCFLHIKKIFS